MIKTVPLHSLVITIGPSAHGRDILISRFFPDYEVISARKIIRELVGDHERPDLNAMVFAEVRRRTHVKLELGERVVIDAANLRKEDRIGLAKLGNDAGIPVFYLICDPAGSSPREMGKFISAEASMLTGDDGIAEVIDGRIDQPDPISKNKPNLAALRRRWSGVTVVGDIHGMLGGLRSVVSWAKSRNHYLIFLGDVIDYGPDTLEVSDEIHRIVMHGEGELILGNHERKIFRWIGEHTDQRISEGNLTTINALAKKDSAFVKKWQTRFKGLFHRANIYRQIGNMLFIHAAVDPRYWNGSHSIRDIESMALFGEFVPTVEGKRPDKTYSWVNKIPTDVTVMVGHDIRSMNSPLYDENEHGGVVVFMDTGSGKGGRLSSADLKFVDDGFRIENFNLH